ncbi:hypothetical protein ABZV93_18480 [Actinopolymorpha sp. NPDC004070]|uniref:hypothetical protein n=1 Tax=Actinopolymorpha sp. NPDC004070 TaxID=3154548 RepID=UPI0033BACF95
MFSAVCQYAVRGRRLLVGPVTGLKLPKPVPAGERMFLTHEEVGKLAAAAGSYALFIQTLAYTGLRWGEATALRVRDVDLERQRLEVRRAFVDIAGKLDSRQVAPAITHRRYPLGIGRMRQASGFRRRRRSSRGLHGAVNIPRM